MWRFFFVNLRGRRQLISQTVIRIKLFYEHVTRDASFQAKAWIQALAIYFHFFQAICFRFLCTNWTILDILTWIKNTSTCTKQRIPGKILVLIFNFSVRFPLGAKTTLNYRIWRCFELFSLWSSIYSYETCNMMRYDFHIKVHFIDGTANCWIYDFEWKHDSDFWDISV